jgi:hypothetical protein
MWLNLGDSYAGSGKGPSNDGKAHRNLSTCTAAPNRWISVPDGIKPKDLVGIPWMTRYTYKDVFSVFFKRKMIKRCIKYLK